MTQKTAEYVLLMLVLAWSMGCTGPAPRAEAARQRRSPDSAVQGPVVCPAAQHRVVRVHDGDSLTLLSDGVQHEARLAGIDAPELRQEFGTAAKSALISLVQGREVTFTDAGQDRYQRTLIRLYTNGMDVNAEIVRRGLAWHYRAYSSDPAFAAAEQEARRFRRNLWTNPNPVPPWEWRHTR